MHFLLGIFRGVEQLSHRIPSVRWEGFWLAPRLTLDCFRTTCLSVFQNTPWKGSWVAPSQLFVDVAKWDTKWLLPFILPRAVQGRSSCQASVPRCWLFIPVVTMLVPGRSLLWHSALFVINLSDRIQVVYMHDPVKTYVWLCHTSAENPPVTSFTSGESQNQWHCWRPGQIAFAGVGEGLSLHCSMFSSIHGLYPPDASGTHPSTLTGSHVPCRTSLFPTENHCFTGIKGPTLSVPVLLLLPLSHPSHNGLCSSQASQYLPVRRPCTCCSLFLKCSPRHPHGIQHSCMDVCNLSYVTSSFPIG